MRFTLFLICFPLLSYSQSLETVIQKGHELAVVTIAISRDSNYVATGSKDKSAKLWEMATGREVRSFLGHEATVTSLQFTPDGKTLITGSNDKSICFWEVLTGKRIYSIQTDDIITDLVIDPLQRFFVVAGYGNSGYGDSITVYDLATRNKIKRISASADKGLGSGVDLAISTDGGLLAVGEDNRTVNLYDTKNWRAINTFQFEEGWCGGCGSRSLFSPDNKNLYIASQHGPVRKYDLSSYTLIKTYTDKIDGLKGFSLSKDGKTLASATEKEIVLWNESTGDSISGIQAKEQAEFNEIEFAVNNKTLLVTSDNNTAVAWNFKNNKNERTLTGYLNQRDQGGLNYDHNFYWQSAIAKYIRFKNSLLISNDGRTLIKGKFGTKIKRWDIATGKTIMEYVGHKKAVLCYDLSSDGKRLLTGGGDGKIILWDLDTGDSLQVIQTYREPIFDIQFSADEKRVASSSWDATMKIHDLETKKLLSYFEFQNASAYDIIFHPNDLYLFTARLDNSLQMWETDTKKEVRNFIGHTDIISGIQLSQDHRSLLSSSWDGTIRIWDVGTGLMTKKFKGHQGAVHSILFSPDEKFVYSAGADRIVRRWDVTSSKVIQTFEGHNAEITALIFSPDHKMLISHSVDGVTKFWDLNTGKEFFEHIHLGENDWMAKSPDGYFNSTEEARKYIHFVDGLKTYAVDQFFEDFYRPDLLPKIFQNRSGKSETKTLQESLKDSPPPSLKLAVIPSTVGKAEIYVRITDNGKGAKNLNLFHNGKSIAINMESLTFPGSRGESTTYKHEVNLVSGSNIFSATVRNRDNIESDIQTAELFSDHVAKNSTCYILAVGINEYKNSKLNLNFARADAESFGQLVNVQSHQLFKNVELHTLYDKNATRQKILNKLDELSLKVSQEDVLIFYYAGHGSMSDNKFFFIPTESSRLYDASSLHKEAIEATLLQDKLKHIKALKQLIVMDACQSGGSVELLATRGATEEKAIAQLSRSAGIHVMASAGSEQFATEFTSLGHGLFTYVLMKGLQGGADGAPRDGKVTIYELKSYVDDQVPELTKKLKGNPQYPFTFSRGHDFPVVVQPGTQ
ncbi:caspase family protein [Chryseolinea sp. H1M3-3]|uniref:caspase family protein n=1 Tax=Chryseolinea sp. H1M3-3 TaxID=3034144 RepID=UPI0023EE04AA|nr:caspase family protein [Chryseolinea sp. H1M3-3]